MAVMNRYVALVIAMLMLAGCSYRVDTNGYYTKTNKEKRIVKCVQERENYTRCYHYGEAK